MLKHKYSRCLSPLFLYRAWAGGWATAQQCIQATGEWLVKQEGHLDRREIWRNINYQAASSGQLNRSSRCSHSTCFRKMLNWLLSCELCECVIKPKTAELEGLSVDSNTVQSVFLHLFKLVLFYQARFQKFSLIYSLYCSVMVLIKVTEDLTIHGWNKIKTYLCLAWKVSKPYLMRDCRFKAFWISVCLYNTCKDRGDRKKEEIGHWDKIKSTWALALGCNWTRTEVQIGNSFPLIFFFPLAFELQPSSQMSNKYKAILADIFGGVGSKHHKVGEDA